MRTKGGLICCFVLFCRLEAKTKSKGSVLLSPLTALRQRIGMPATTNSSTHRTSLIIALIMLIAAPRPFVQPALLGCCCRRQVVGVVATREQRPARAKDCVRARADRSSRTLKLDPAAQRAAASAVALALGVVGAGIVEGDKASGWLLGSLKLIAHRANSIGWREPLEQRRQFHWRPHLGGTTSSYSRIAMRVLRQ